MKALPDSAADLIARLLKRRGVNRVFALCGGHIMPIWMRLDAEGIQIVDVRDERAAVRLGEGLQTGTFFQNRCDYLDPALAWVGVKDSGRGCTLSVIGYEHLTRPKSFHMRVTT